MLYQCLGSGYEIQREGNPTSSYLHKHDAGRHGETCEQHRSYHRKIGSECARADDRNFTRYGPLTTI
jgi:hypothetical protein